MRGTSRVVLLAAALICVAILGSQSTVTISASSGSIAPPHELAGLPRAHAPLAVPPRPAKDNDLRFKHLSSEQGLSQSVVPCMLQDSLGFMWFCTQDGLNRFDGYNFKVYKRDPADSNTLSDNVIQALFEGKDNALWIGTNAGGLNRYDLVTGQFRQYQNDPNDPTSIGSNGIAAVYEDPRGVLWVGTTDAGLYRLDPGKEQFVRYTYNPSDPHTLGSNVTSSLVPAPDGTLWIGTNGGGLNHLDTRTGQFTRYQNDPSNASSLGSNLVLSLRFDRNGILWVGTNSGLDRFDPQTNGFVHFRNEANDPHSLCGSAVLSIYQDRDQTLWVGTNECVNRLDAGSQEFVHYRNDPNNPSSLSNSQGQSIYQDRSGVLWIGTFGGGVNLFDPTTARFHNYQNDPNDAASLVSDLVWSIYQAPHGEIWVGTMRGLDKLDPDTGRFVHYKNDPSNPDSLRTGTVMSMVEDAQGALWIGLWDGGVGGGLDRFDRATGKFIHYQTAGVTTVAQDDQGTLWIGTLGGGLGKYQRDPDQFTYYVNNPNDRTSISVNAIGKIYQDREGQLWVGTFNGGLDRLDRETGRFTHFKNSQDPTSLSINTVLSIYQDRKGVLWVGTSGGLDRFDAAAGKFAAYTTKDGLPNETIYGILEDSVGRLWLSTNRGISRFDPQAETFKNYDVGDGLPSDEFNQGAYWASSSGELYFGGIKGVTRFNPEDLPDNAYSPPIALTELTQSGRDLDVGGTVERARQVTLEWPNNLFEFEFAALGYTQPEKSQYAYMLEGFDKTWNPAGTRRFGNYTNLPGGTFKLRIKASNNDGVWSEQAAPVMVTVVPPFWETWWFRGLAAGVLVLGTLGAFRLRVRVLEEQRRRLAVQVEEKTKELSDTLVELKHSKEVAEAANRAKSVFLANMSHELRTPLNAVLGFTQLMVRDPNLTPAQQENLAIISRSGEHLLGLINEVLQLSKIEAGRITLNEQAFDLYRMLDGLEEMFRLRASEKGLEMVLVRDPETPRFALTDEGKLRQVLMNLLGNAVKFTDAGRVILRVKSIGTGNGDASNVCLHFEVEDTGPGIPPEELKLAFEPFEQTSAGRNQLEGTGLGLPISQQFVNMLGGQLTVISPVPGHEADVSSGSLFKFNVIAKSVDVSALPAERRARRVVGLEPDQPVYRVLIVEDNWANRRLLQQLLEPLGFEVKEAANGSEAVKIWEEWTPHLIFMDMRMPVMDGYEATRRIRATTRGQATVIIALTASALEEDRHVILSEGCDAFIRKPFREEELFEAMAKHLGVRFKYESEVISAGTLRPSPREGLVAKLAPAAAAVPAELLTELKLATVKADLSAIAAAIDMIRLYDAVLADALSNLAENFEHDAILQVIQAGDGDRRAEGAQ